MAILAVVVPCLSQSSSTPPANQPSQEAPAKPGMVASLLWKASEFLGTPYRHGGTTPKGFDCSGFVRHVFGTFGIQLNRSSSAQAAQGDRVNLEDIQPGDVLFFKTRGPKGGISHVGIYLGNGEFIHAGAWGGPSKRVVKITELDSTYYSKRLVAARRFLCPTGNVFDLPDQLLPASGTPAPASK